MGFLDNLLKKETRKLISNVVDGVVDSVMNTSGNAVRSAIHTAGDSENDEASCRRSVPVIRQRIEKILADSYPGCSYKKDIPISEYGMVQPGNCVKHEIDYIITDSTGREIAAVLLLSPGMERTDWRRKLSSLFQERNIKHVHFLMHLPNRGSYIREKLGEILN